MSQIPFDEYIGLLHYFANKYQSRHTEHWELINEAWIVSHKIKHKHWLSNSIKWGMLTYKQKKYRNKFHGRKNGKVKQQSLYDELAECFYLKDLIPDPVSGQPLLLENKEEVNYYLKRIRLKDRLLIDMYFFRDLSIYRIAKYFKCTHQNIGLKLRRILRNLKEIHDYRSNN